MTEEPSTSNQEEGLFGAARETGIGVLIGLFVGLAALMRPGVRGHEPQALYGLTAAGALTFLIRFLLASLSDRCTASYYLSGRSRARSRVSPSSRSWQMLAWGLVRTLVSASSSRARKDLASIGSPARVSGILWVCHSKAVGTDDSGTSWGLHSRIATVPTSALTRLPRARSLHSTVG